jgi:hypothetical protein
MLTPPRTPPGRKITKRMIDTPKKNCQKKRGLSQDCRKTKTMAPTTGPRNEVCPPRITMKTMDIEVKT